MKVKILSKKAADHLNMFINAVMVKQLNQVITDEFSIKILIKSKLIPEKDYTIILD